MFHLHTWIAAAILTALIWLVVWLFKHSPKPNGHCHSCGVEVAEGDTLCDQCWADSQI